MWYNVDYIRLVTELTPTFLRKPALVGFVRAVTSPIAAIYYDWKQSRVDHMYKLAHNGQICYLRKSLNDKFDPEFRRIYIGDGNTFERDYIYTRAEEQLKPLGTIYLQSSLDYADTGIDFIVFVPAEIVALHIYGLHAHIQYYREGVKRYRIQEI